jgi:PAS domain S-box-containing protein
MSMKDETKSKEELIHELKSLRQQVVRFKERESLNDLARKALSKSVETFRGLFEQASDSIFLLELKGDEGPIIADANIAACRAHGYTKSELLEQPIRMLDAAETASHIDERTKRIARGEKLTFEGEHNRKDGTVFPVEVSAQLITIAGKQYILAMDRDITERKKSLDRIRQERDRAQLFFEFAGVMLVVIDADQTVGMINKKGRDILGYTGDEIIGQNWFDLCIPERIREDVRSIFERLISGEIEPVEYYENPVVNKHGDERAISWHNTILRDDKGEVIATLSSGEEVDKRN